MDTQKNCVENCTVEPGFTLVELLVSVTIMMIMGGAAYSTFNSVIKIYQKSGTRMVLTQKCRIALDYITTDLSNLQAIEGDENLLIVSQDNPSEEAIGDQDLVSFVTLLPSDPDPVLSQLNASNELEEEQQESLMTDVKRVAYYIGPDPTGLEEDSEERGSRLTDGSQEDQQIVLLRITTTSLDPETVILPLLESGTLPVEDEEGNPIQVDVVPLIDQILSFDLKYYDGEELYDSWEDEEQIPKAIQVTISMSADADKIEGQSQDIQTSQDIQNNMVTQSTMVYLLMSANFSDPTAMTSL
ncbi:MAG: prepilin-type N-terminal cleavage/methylation domain-containing protein [Candidatus Poribacteria bacterium]|nr:prepilin-type N-terminal cleavage/methylation domain-containing protein [Candidatus Poribacteria bacterium]